MGTSCHPPPAPSPVCVCREPESAALLGQGAGTGAVGAPCSQPALATHLHPVPAALAWGWGGGGGPGQLSTGSQDPVVLGGRGHPIAPPVLPGKRPLPSPDTPNLLTQGEEQHGRATLLPHPAAGSAAPSELGLQPRCGCRHRCLYPHGRQRSPPAPARRGGEGTWPQLMLMSGFGRC